MSPFTFGLGAFAAAIFTIIVLDIIRDFPAALTIQYVLGALALGLGVFFLAWAITIFDL